jgi:glycosyltransferase involved in cell wall biosynthesis
MNICIVIDSVLPALLYGGTERVVVWLGRALQQQGHRVTYLARAGSVLDFAEVRILDKSLPIDPQLPPNTDLVHFHSEMTPPQSVPFCTTIHGNTRHARSFHPNTIFVSQRHAHNHGAKAFVHLGLDPLEYGLPSDLSRPGSSFIFLGKAAWRLKNVRGAIRIARFAGAPLDVLGGTRLNFKMGFRWTWDRNARFHGMVGGEAKNNILRQSRGLIFPVLWHEPGATAIIESLYFGLPVFGTPYGCLPELVPPEAGVLSAHEDELVEAARQVHRFDKRAIHDWWKKGFTSSVMAGKYLHYYTRILDGENLHPDVIESVQTRSADLLPWHKRA